jgi:hypothetical protein
MLKEKFEKKKKTLLKSTRVNLSNLQPDNKIRMTPYKTNKKNLQSLIFNQLNVEKFKKKNQPKLTRVDMLNS